MLFCEPQWSCVLHMLWNIINTAGSADPLLSQLMFEGAGSLLHIARVLTCFCALQ